MLASALGALIVAGPLAERTVARATVKLPTQRFSIQFLHVPGSNGYDVSVTGTDGDVTLSADSPSDGVSYETAGTVTDERIAADFGPVGSVDVAFTPQGEPRTVRRNEAGCSIRTTTQPGVYAGSLVFAGENGFSSATASSAPGQSVSQVIRCAAPGSIGHDDGDHGTVLEADGRSAVGRTTFWATKVDGRPRPLFNAWTTSRVGAVTVVRYASAWGRRGDFRFDRHRRSRARVTPPAPFSGTARFARKGKGKTTWSGDLAVPLPGLIGTTALAGDDFAARLHRDGLILFTTNRASRLGPNLPGEPVRP